MNRLDWEYKWVIAGDVIIRISTKHTRIMDDPEPDISMRIEKETRPTIVDG